LSQGILATGILSIVILFTACVSVCVCVCGYDQMCGVFNDCRQDECRCIVDMSVDEVSVDDRLNACRLDYCS
jgi:hypothetical protein